MQVISKPNGTNNIQNPTTSAHLHCYCPPTAYFQHSCQSDSAYVTPLFKILWCLLSHPEGVSYCYCLSTPNPFFYTWFYVAGPGPLKTTLLLCPLAPCWAWPVGGARGRWHPWRREKGVASFLFCFLWVFYQLVAPVSGVSALPLHPGSGSSFL